MRTLRNYARSFAGWAGATLALGLVTASVFGRCEPEENLTEYGRMAREIRIDVLENGSTGYAIIEPFKNIPLLNKLQWREPNDKSKTYSKPDNLEDITAESSLLTPIADINVGVFRPGIIFIKSYQQGSAHFRDIEGDGFADGKLIEGGGGILPVTEKDQEDYHILLRTAFRRIKR